MGVIQAYTESCRTRSIKHGHFCHLSWK